MRPDISGDLDDSGAEDLINLAQFDGKNMQVSFFFRPILLMKISI